MKGPNRQSRPQISKEPRSQRTRQTSSVFISLKGLIELHTEMKAQAVARQKGSQHLPPPRPCPHISKAVSMCG